LVNFKIMTDDTNINQDDWEAICQRCACCCYEKVLFEGAVYYTETPCQYLDVAAKECTVYEQRDRVRRGCVRLTPAILPKGFLPAHCPYVADIDNYPAPFLPEDDTE
jgi:uncharacterized cysteine cluster protein YcgN (CxxCxxCC family)